jgi:beta-glucosidase/6-phospho-beta-glucosidase/beta-galactosidase
LGLNGTISFKTNGGYKIPLTNSSDDLLATQRAWDFNEGWFADPVYINGDYPETLKTYVSTLGLELTDEQKTLIKGTGDIFAHDAYTSSFYFAPDAGVAGCGALQTRQTHFILAASIRAISILTDGTSGLRRIRTPRG